MPIEESCFVIVCPIVAHASASHNTNFDSFLNRFPFQEAPAQQKVRAEKNEAGKPFGGDGWDQPATCVQDGKFYTNAYIKSISNVANTLRLCVHMSSRCHSSATSAGAIDHFHKLLAAQQARRAAQRNAKLPHGDDERAYEWDDDVEFLVLSQEDDQLWRRESVVFARHTSPHFIVLHLHSGYSSPPYTTSSLLSYGWAERTNYERRVATPSDMDAAQRGWRSDAAAQEFLPLQVPLNASEMPTWQHKYAFAVTMTPK
jgi:hypothetical protein